MIFKTQPGDGFADKLVFNGLLSGANSFKQIANTYKEGRDAVVGYKTAIDDANLSFKQFAKNSEARIKGFFHLSTLFNKNQKEIKQRTAVLEKDQQALTEYFTEYEKVGRQYNKRSLKPLLDNASDEAKKHAKQLNKEQIRSMGGAEAATQSFVTQQQSAIDVLKKSTVASKAAAVGMNLLKMAMNTIATIAIQLAIQALIKGIDELAHKQENLMESAREAAEAYEETTKEIASQEEELKKVQDRLKELNAIEHKTLAEEQETTELREQNALLSYRISLLKQKQAAEAAEKKETADKAWKNADTSGLSNSYDATGRKLKWYEQDWAVALSNALSASEDGYGTYQPVEIPVNYSEVDAGRKAVEALKEAQQELDTLLAKDSLTDAENARVSELNESIAEYKSNISEIAEHWIDSDNEEAASFAKELTFAISDTEDKAAQLATELENIGATIDVDSLARLAVEGKLTAENFEELAGSKVAESLNEITGSTEQTIIELKALGEVAEEAAEKTSVLADEIGSLSSAQSALSAFKSAINDIANDGAISFSTLADISENFSALGTEALDDYINKILEAGTNTEKLSQIFSGMTYAMLESKLGVEGLANANKDLVTSLLESCGVTNADAMATLYMTEAKARAKIASFDFTTATDDQTIALIKEVNAMGASLQALDIIIDKYARIKAKSLPNAARMSAATFEWYKESIRQELVGDMDFSDIDFQPIYSGYEVSSKSSSKSSKTSDDPRLERWKEMLAEKKHLLEMDQLTEEQYYDWLRNNYKKELNDSKKYADEWRQYEEELYKWDQEKWDRMVAEKDHLLAMGQITEDEYYDWLIANYRNYITDREKLWEIEEKIYEREQDKLEEAKDAVEELIDYRIEMIKKEKEKEKEALQERQDNIQEFYDTQRDMLRDYYDEKDKIEERQEKRKDVTDIQAELLELSADDSAAAQKRRLELEEELAEAEKDLQDFERDEELERAEEMYDKLEEMQVEALDTQIELIDKYLDNAKALRDSAILDLQHGNELLYKEMIEYNRIYGLILWFTYKAICMINYTYMRGLPKALYQNRKMKYA